MSDFIGPILQWLNANPGLAGIATFIISAAESVAIIGTIIPGTVMMTAIGALAGAGVVPFWPILFSAILGAIAGDGISYWIGYHFKERLHYVWPFKYWPSLLQNGEKFFRAHGGKSVFIGRFVGPVRALVPLIAGMLGVKPLRFMIANIASAIGWAPIYMLPGVLLGAASLELPPDVTIHVILMLFLFGLFIIFAIWLIGKLSIVAGQYVTRFLNRIWNRLIKSRYFHLIPTLLKHHNPQKAHGQLTLAFYFIITVAAFLYLATYVYFKNPQNILLNNVLFHLFRSLRTTTGDEVMLCLTLLGEKTVLFPLILTLFIWFAWKKSWHIAWHTLALGLLSAVSIKGLKWLIHEPRPWGIINNMTPHNFSFPSGHATLSVVFYFGIALLLIDFFKIRYRKPVYFPAAIIILAVSFSRLYFGAHWFTDLIAGWLLGAALLMLVTLSYNRKTEKNLASGYQTILVILLTLFFSYIINFLVSSATLKQKYTALERPTYTTTLNNWWQQKGDHFPLYRVNRFGFSSQIFNIQWVGNLSRIKELLLQNGWEIPPERDWASILYRVADIKSAEYLPLVSPVYLDKNPVLVLIKHKNGNKKLIVLHLWDSYFTLQDSPYPLWLGSIDIIPSTYSWLFKRKNKYNGDTDTLSSPAVLFSILPAHYEIKQVNILVNSRKNRAKEQAMILIKPRS